MKTFGAWQAFGARAPAAQMAWLDQLRGIGSAAIDGVLAEVPEARMTDTSKTFTRALLIENHRRLLEGDDA